MNDKKEILELQLNENKKTVLVFYASWCHDCKREMPKMKSAFETNFSNFDFIAITDEGYDKMKKFKENNSFPFQFYTILKSFDEINIYAIPTTYILNSKNEILFSKVGDIDWESKKFIESMKEK